MYKCNLNITFLSLLKIISQLITYINLLLSICFLCEIDFIRQNTLHLSLVCSFIICSLALLFISYIFKLVKYDETISLIKKEFGYGLFYKISCLLFILNFILLIYSIILNNNIILPLIIFLLSFVNIISSFVIYKSYKKQVINK